MLNRKYVVVTKRPQSAAEIFPLLQAVTITHAAEHPTALADISVALGIQVSVETAVVGVDLGVLRVDVEKRAFSG